MAGKWSAGHKGRKEVARKNSGGFALRMGSIKMTPNLKMRVLGFVAILAGAIVFLFSRAETSITRLKPISEEMMMTRMMLPQQFETVKVFYYIYSLVAIAVFLIALGAGFFALSFMKRKK